MRTNISKKKKVQWELIGREEHGAMLCSSSFNCYLKMRDNPLSHASRFTAKLVNEIHTHGQNLEN